MNLNDFLTAADTTAVQAGGRSIFEKLGDALTAGAAGATISGLASIANTAIYASNKVFGREVEEFDTAEVLRGLDENWARYYEENKGVIDTVGFIGGSFIPGGAAVKALNLARTGRAAGVFSRIPGLNSLHKQEEYLRAGLNAVAEGKTVYSTINANKLLSMAHGAADNALQAAVFWIATATTMARGPVLVDESWSDISWDTARNALVGGVIGGGIVALWTNGIFKNAAKAIDKHSRQYDTNAALEKLNLSFGHSSFKIADEALNLPDEVAENARLLDFTYRINGRDRSIQLKPGTNLDRKLRETVDKTLELFKSRITNFSENDTTLGAPVGRMLFDIVRQGLDTKVAKSKIREELLTYLHNLQGIRSLGSVAEDFTQDIMYLIPGAGMATARQTGKDLFSSARLAPDAQGYRIVGNLANAKSGIVGTESVGKTLQEAWDNGFDIAFTGKTGRAHINPNSSIFKRVDAPEDGVTRMVLNLETKRLTDTSAVSIADVATSAKPLNFNASGVFGGKYSFKFSPGDEVEDSLDSLYHTARNLWASQIDDLRNTTIGVNDFALQDRLLELVSAGAAQNVHRTMAGTKLGDDAVTDLVEQGSLAATIFRNKVEYAQKLLDEAGKAKETIDLTALAYRMNVKQSWFDEIISKQFDQSLLRDSEAAHKSLADYAIRDNVLMVYKKPPATPDTQFASPYVEYQHRVALAREQTKTAGAYALGAHVTRFLDVQPAAVRDSLSSEGAGPRAFGSANANYDDPARVFVQDVGRATHLTIADAEKAALEPIHGMLTQAVTKGNKELGAVLAKYRLTAERLMLLDGKIVAWKEGKKLQQLKTALADQLDSARPDNEAINKLSAAVQDFKFREMAPIEVSEETYALLERYHEGHKVWLSKYKALNAAHGRSVPWDEDALHLPPIDTQSVPFFAFVKRREGAIQGDSQVAMITARNADELQQKVNDINANFPDLAVYFKKDIEDFYKAKGEYEYARAMNEPTLDPFLRSKGKLGDFYPTLEPQAIAEEFIRHISRRESTLVRDSVQTFYSQEFAEMQWLSNQFTKIEESATRYMGRADIKKVADPFGDYIRTALDISKRSTFPLWHQLNEFVDAGGTKAYGLLEARWRAARAGQEDWVEANKVLKQVGLGEPYTDQMEYLRAQYGTKGNLLKTVVSKGNMLLANVALRLDVANSMLGIISMPILNGLEVASIRNSLKKNPQLFEAFNAQLQEAVPGTQLKAPSATRLLFTAVNNFFSPQKQALIARYADEVGSVRPDIAVYHEMLSEVALTPNLVPNKFAGFIDKWTEKGAKWTGNNWAEEFTRFAASDVMRQITNPVVAAGRMSRKEQNAFIAIYANRVHGNYITSQRPIAFQGTIGAAIGLFQTYMFNVLQQVFRHIENRDAKTLAIGASLQGTIFGLGGLPLFDAINTHIIGNANINDGHHDVYSRVAAADKEWGDFAMYGLASAAPFLPGSFPALYTRGDLNPRHISILPTSFSNIPVVEATTRVASAVWSAGKQVVNGADLSDAFLHGLAHNGVSRPLAGLATALAGESTTSKGGLIAAHTDLVSIATATRLIGAKPVDESLVMNHRYRLKAYKAADRERISELGAVVKEKLRAGEGLTEEEVLDFASRYAQVGGRADNFSAALQRWTKTANESEANKVARALQTSYGQRMWEVMGGDELPDYENLIDE